MQFSQLCIKLAAKIPNFFVHKSEKNYENNCFSKKVLFSVRYSENVEYHFDNCTNFLLRKNHFTKIFKNDSSKMSPGRDEYFFGNHV